MSSPASGDWKADRRTLFESLGVLGLSVGLVWAVVGFWRQSVDGSVGFRAVSIAALVTGVSGAAALVLLVLLKRRMSVGMAVIAGMLLRVPPPLFVILQSVSHPDSELAQAQTADLTVAFFLLVLFIEVGLSLRFVDPNPPRRSSV
jgi:hypothetical protein